MITRTYNNSLINLISVDTQTGFLCEASPEEFAKAAATIIKDKNLGEKMGDMGRKHVDQRFSFNAFTEKLNQIVMALCEKKKK